MNIFIEGLLSIFKLFSLSSRDFYMNNICIDVFHSINVSVLRVLIHPNIQSDQFLKYFDVYYSSFVGFSV